MTKDTPRKTLPKEGGNRGHDVEKFARTNITETVAGRPPKEDSDHTDDALPSDVQPTEGENDTPQPDPSDRKPRE